MIIFHFSQLFLLYLSLLIYTFVPKKSVLVNKCPDLGLSNSITLAQCGTHWNDCTPAQICQGKHQKMYHCAAQVAYQSTGRPVAQCASAKGGLGGRRGRTTNLFVWLVLKQWLWHHSVCVSCRFCEPKM